MLIRTIASFPLAALLFTSSALAQTGVSDDRVSLPDGPGSLDGLGDNASVAGNMGQMSYSVPIRVPEYFAEVTPQLSLDYSSGGGSGVLGIGWSFGAPFVERMTSRGLPVYDDGDLFVINGAEEVVRVSADDAEPAVYRARFEGGFVRYSWHQRGAGDEGYWTAEYPSGTTSYFGAGSDGAPDETARVRSPEGVFRYLITETVDRYGHRLTYDYAIHGSVPLLENIAYGYDDDGNAEYSVTFDYDYRDVMIVV